MQVTTNVHAQTTVFYADFENGNGDNNWTFNGGASDGNWLRGQPSPYNTGNISMEIAAFGGSNDLVTGVNFSQDVDLGPTSARSSSILIPAGNTSLDLAYYFSYYTNSSISDYLLVELRDQLTDNTLESLVLLQGNAAGRNAFWSTVTRDISAYSGSSVYLYVESADLGNPSKVEAALDNIEITNTVVTPPSGNCTVLISDDFEGGLGNWNDPGSDCARINNSTFASNGSFSLRLRDNSNTSMTTSIFMDMSTMDTAIIDFSFMASSMENNEDFWLQVSRNPSDPFVTIEDWVSGSDFVNNVRYYEQVVLTGPFSTGTRFRFVCDATANGDRVYFDEISITGCETQVVVDCPLISLQDTSACGDTFILIDGDPMSNDSIISHLWTDLNSGSASGYALSNTNEQTVSINTTGAARGSIFLSYTASTTTCSISDTIIVQLSSEPICEIISDVDTICSSTTLLLEAKSNYLVTPDSGMVVPANSGVGFTQTHQIIGVQDPNSTKIIVTLPTWDDHFDTILLNGQMIIPEIFETDSYNLNGMNCQSPWIANVNGLPRSILEISQNEVRYFSSLTTTSTSMTEVFPTNWVTTPQLFVEGTNTFQFGIQNTNGPVSGSWFVEAIGTIGYTYLWSTGETSKDISVTPTETTTYQLTITSPNGCQSVCDKTITVFDGFVDSINYVGCSGDGYGIIYNGVVYDESNPTDTIIVPFPGCDSIMYINLVYSQPPIVYSGSSPAPLCTNADLILSDLNASITGSITEGTWTSTGGGTFDNGGNFGGTNPATTYIPSEAEIKAGKMILTLTSHDPPGSCEPVADAVMIPINDIRCSNFPWSGQY